MGSERNSLLSIHLLGRFEVTLNGQPVTGFATDKTRALLAYLATEFDRPHRRQALAGLLWPDYPERSARTSLRTALANLRQVIGDRRANPPFLDISRQAIRLNGSRYLSADVITLHHATQNAQTSIEELEALADGYQGRFLDGFSLADSPLFDEWILLTRERTERLMMAALDRLTLFYQERGEPQKALNYARLRVELDPWQEAAQRQLMYLLTVTGHRPTALTEYDAFRRLLAEELGVEPDRETVRLYEDIRDGKLRESVVALVGAIRSKRSPLAALADSQREETSGRPFVGRTEELKRLHAHLQKAIEGRGRVVFVSAGSGRGKTALLDEFARQALSRSPIVVANGICNAYSGLGDPYLPFRQVLAMLTGDLEDAWVGRRISRTQAERLLEVAPSTLRAIVEAGPDLIETFLPRARLKERARAVGSDSADWLSRVDRLIRADAAPWERADFAQQALIEQYVQILERIARKMPLLIIVDDLHWADRGSVEMLLHLGRRLESSRILTLCAYRPDELTQDNRGTLHPLADAVNELRRLYGEITMDLAIADAATSRKFVDDLIDVEPNGLTLDFREALHKRTDGHPLFTLEILRMLQARGDLVRDADHHWVEGQKVEWDDVPARVEAVIEKRVGRLSPSAYELLSVASVQGEEFSAEVISRIVDGPDRKVLRILAQDLGQKHRLVQERVELKQGRGPVSRFRFSHQLIQQYVYNSLSASERGLLHWRVAEALEELYDDEIEDVTVQLAYHYSRTGKTEKAIYYLTRAGHQARSRYDGEEAIRYYSEALSLTPDDHPGRFELLAARGAIYGLLAKREAQKADIDALQAIASHLDNRALQCDALFALADFCLATEPFLAREPAEQARQIAQSMDDSVRVAHALRRLAWAGRLAADFQTSIMYVEEAVALFASAGMPGEAADCLFMLARRLPGSGEHAFEPEAAERAITLSQEAGNYRLEAVAKKNLAIVYMNDERYSEALRLAEAALAKQRDLGDRGEECRTLDVLGVIFARLGEQEDAFATLTRCLAIAEEIDSDWEILGAVFGLWNYWYIPNGEYEGFLTFIDQRLRNARTKRRFWLEGFFGWVRSKTLADVGRLEEALNLAQNVGGPVKENDPVSYVIAREATGSLKSQLGRFGAGREDLEKALELAERTTDSYLVTWPLLGLANLALLEGRQEALSQGLEQATAAFEAASTMREIRQMADALKLSARLHLALRRPEEALEETSKLIDLWESHSYLPGPQSYCHTHSLALRTLGQESHANQYLRRAFEHVQFVADKFEDPSLRQSWLENVGVNREIVSTFRSLGLDSQ